MHRVEVAHEHHAATAAQVVDVVDEHAKLLGAQLCVEPLDVRRDNAHAARCQLGNQRHTRLATIKPVGRKAVEQHHALRRCESVSDARCSTAYEQLAIQRTCSKRLARQQSNAHVANHVVFRHGQRRRVHRVPQASQHRNVPHLANDSVAVQWKE